MKRFVSTALVVVLLLGLGTLAVLARGGGDILTPAGDVVAAAAQSQTAAAPDAPAATPKWNNVALPLDVSNQFTFNANGLIDYIGRSSVTEVRWWNAAVQAYQKCTTLPSSGCSGTNFSLATGAAYMVQLNASDPSKTVVSFVGDVPPAGSAPGSVHFTLTSGSPCKWNAISLPLDQSAITNAIGLIDALGGYSAVSEVREWNATSNPQSFRKCTVLPGTPTQCSGTNFTTKIGYPYWACLKTGTTWP